MVKILVLTHGSLAQSLYDTLGMFFTSRQGVSTLSLGEDMSDFKERVKAELLQTPAKEILVLTDLFGGTPFNTAAALLPEMARKGKRMEVLTGVNLPMLMELMPLLPDSSLPVLKAAAWETGKASIRDLNAELGRIP